MFITDTNGGRLVTVYLNADIFFKTNRILDNIAEAFK